MATGLSPLLVTLKLQDTAPLPEMMSPKSCTSLSSTMPLPTLICACATTPASIAAMAAAIFPSICPLFPVISINILAKILRILKIKSKFVRFQVRRAPVFGESGRCLWRRQLTNCFIMAYKISEDCVACGTCAGECPTGAISEGSIYVIDPNVCIDCGTCADACPMGAISPAE